MYNHDKDYQKREKDPVEKFILPPVETQWEEMMEEYLLGRNLSFDVAKDNGWYPATVRSEPCIIIRSTSLGFPGLGFWQARAMLPQAKFRYDSPKGNRFDSLCIVKNSKMNPTTLIICEGPMDALAAADIKECDGVATFGAMPSSNQLYHLDKLSQKYEYCIVVPDYDFPAFIGKIVMAIPNAKHLSTLLSGAKDLSSLSKEDRECYINNEIILTKLRITNEVP